MIFAPAGTSFLLTAPPSATAWSRISSAGAPMPGTTVAMPSGGGCTAYNCTARGRRKETIYYSARSQGSSLETRMSHSLLVLWWVELSQSEGANSMLYLHSSVNVTREGFSLNYSESSAILRYEDDSFLVYSLFILGLALVGSKMVEKPESWFADFPADHAGGGVGQSLLSISLLEWRAALSFLFFSFFFPPGFPRQPILLKSSNTTCAGWSPWCAMCRVLLEGVRV